MKIQLDTEKKTIQIEEEINLNDFFTLLNELLPNNKWQEFTLITQNINNWSNPIIIKEYPCAPWSNPYNPNPQTSPTPPWITYTADNSNYKLDAGIFNIEVKQ